MAEKEESKNGSRVCGKCSKVFSNGKALGGHMSTGHVQLEKDQKLKLELQNSSGSDHSSLEEITCPYSTCGEVFSSSKALHGHMKKHKDRPHRGMASASKGVSYLEHVSRDNGLDCPTAGNVQSSSEPVSINNRIDCGVAKDVQSDSSYGLVSGSSNSTLCEPVCTRDPHIASIHQMLKSMSNDNSGNVEDVSISSQVLESADQINQATDCSLGNHTYIANRPTSPPSNTTSHVLPVDAGPRDTLESAAMFTCEDCGKKFNTHQALGGHRASHTKPKRVSIVNSSDHVNKEQAQKKRRKSMETHPCDVCGNDFETSKGLKLHKRSHAAADQTSSSEALPRTTTSSQAVILANENGQIALSSDVCNKNSDTSHDLELHMRTDHVVLGEAPVNSIMILEFPIIEDSDAVIPANENVQDARRPLDFDLNLEPPFEE